MQKYVDPDLKPLKDMTNEAVGETGFEILAHRLEFFGIREDCKKKERVKKFEKETST